MDNPSGLSPVDLREIEEVLDAHALVESSTVTVHTDAERGTYLVAYVAVQQELSQHELRMYVGMHLSDDMVPAVLYMMRELPLTQDGKIDHRSLPKPSLRGGSGRMPATPEERVLCDLYAEVLGVPEVGPEDGFFDFGGHSLLANRLIDLIRISLGLDIPLRSVFEAPRVCDLAISLKTARAAQPPFPQRNATS
ncbi:phosphopantetheine-binding protein [Streptomyces sp. NPDC059755]|uniref:phosphopantetheine-binding protein n=1 Tax=Streptomyces sp. NPDC059755 TaxID=3346934 RepID=UPI00366A4F88